MPRILENDAAALAQGIDSMDAADRPQALDILSRYKKQQDDAGEPEWPSQVQAAQDAQNRVRAMYAGGIDKVPFEVSPWSQDPALDKATVANQAFLAHAYNKPLQEIADRPDFYRNDYARQFFGQPGGVDEKTFYGLAAKQIQGQQQKEEAILDGAKAALRGEDIISSLQSWQQKNGMERMPDSTQFTQGYLAAKQRAGDHLEFADNLLKQIESNTGLTKSDGEQRPAPASQEQAAQFNESLAALAEMKPRDRKQVYAIIGAKAEAAGYDQKGFWAQMLSELGKGMARMGSTVTTQAGVTADVLGKFPEMLTNTMKPEDFASTDASIARRHGIGEMYDEVANIVSGTVDPVKPVIGWLPDSVETGLIKAPGAVAPFMAASVALGPVGAGALFTADFAEQNRRDLRAQGLDNDQAIKIGFAAAPIQAAAESLSNALQLGRFPAVQRALAGLTKPIAGGAGLASRYVLNAGASVATEYAEEQLQDNIIRPAVQNVAAAFDKDVPQIGMGEIWDNIKKSSPDLLMTLAPMALVFGGVMTAAQANLSAATISSQDMLEATGYSAAQANAIRSQASPDSQIAKARELWGQRSGTPQSMEDAAKSLSERMKLLQTDHAAAQADLEQRGILPRMLRAADDKWRLTFNDGSVADFNSHQEADAARWQWATDQLGKVHLATREALAQMERGAEVGREFAVEFKPDARFATEEELQQPDFQARVKQGEVLDNPDATYQDAVAVAKAAGDDSHAVQILGSSVNEFKDGVLRTTMRLYEGAHILTLVEEKLEGDAKSILSGAQGRAWMLQHLRAYEQASGDKLFAENDDANVTDKMLVEAWSHLGQAYLVGKSSDAQAVQGNNARRMFRYILNSGLSPEMNAETQYWRSVALRAQKLGELKQSGKLGADVTAELEKQLGIDSQAKHEDEAAKEADAIANEALYAGGPSYSEENPGPNGETFSLQGGNKAATSGMASDSGAAQHAEPSPGGLSEAEVQQIAVSKGLIPAFHGTNGKFKKLDVKRSGQGIVWFAKNKKRIERGESGASGNGRIIKAYLNLKNPAGWDEYDSKSIAELIRDGYDGVILPEEDGDADYIIFENKQIIYPDEVAAFESSRAEGGTTYSVRKFDFSSRLAHAAQSLQTMRQQGQTVDFSKAYQAAAVGQSTAMLSLDSIYQHARQQLPSLTTQQFGKQVQALYDSGHLMLEPGESAASMRDTLNLYGVRDSLGIPSMYVGPVAQETFSMSRAIPASTAHVVEMPDGARIVGPTTFSIRVYHGTPHKVDKFDLGKIGTGEGAQAYGWGLYFAGNKAVAEGYKSAGVGSAWIDSSTGRKMPLYASAELSRYNGDKKLALKALRAYDQDYQAKLAISAIKNSGELQSIGNLYTVDLLPDEEDFLDWDKPLSEQPEIAKKLGIPLRDFQGEIDLFEKANALGVDVETLPEYSRHYAALNDLRRNQLGMEIYQDLEDGESSRAASQKLASLGIPGLKYLDAGSRGAGDGTRNYVIFDDKLVKILEENGKPVETHSIRSGDYASRIAAMFSPFQRSPELRLAIAQVAKARAQKLGAQWIEKAAEIRSAADIGKEARMREALAYDARMQEYLDGLTPEARQTLEQEPTGLEDDPLIAAMLDHGRLMSRSTAKRLGKVEAKSGDYDGVPRLPASWYSKGAGIMPDQMAQAMHDAGLLKDAHTDTLWQALENRIGSHVKNKAEYDRAQDAYKAAEKYARDASRAESDKWAEGAKKKAGSPKAQREMLKAALRTLDGILSAAPPEVRARVGGYVKIAGLATDEAMLREIESRIEKLNTELEKWLKKEGLAQVEKLLKKGRPFAESGKKAKGKDADLHHLFSAAEKASKMDAAAVAGELARLDSLIAGDTLTPEQEALATTERGLVELLGDLKNADSGRIFSAIDTLRSIYDGAWLKWKLAEIERKERRAGMRQDFITDTGKQGVKIERDAADKAAVTLLGKIKGGFLSLSSFHEVLAYCFGEKSDRVKSLVDAERAASGQYEDMNQALADEVEELFTDMAGSVLAGERLRFDMAQRTIKTGKGELSQLEAIQALLMWRQEDGRRHMEGHLDESGKPVGKWHYDQAWIDEITAALSPEARRLMGWIMQKYGVEWAALNPLYRARYGVNLPAHDNYAPITVTPAQTKAGEVVDPVTGAAMSSGSILTPGSLRTRSRSAVAEPEFRDALQTLLNHTRQLEYWKAYYDLATEANAILGNREVLNAVKAKGGEQASTALRKWVDAIAQGGFRDASASLEINKMLSRMTGRAATVGLLGRVSTLLVQSTQLAAASVKMPLGRYLVGMSKLLTGNLSYRDSINSDFIQRRYKSAPPLVKQSMQNLGAASRPNHITRSSRDLGQLVSGADALFTAGTYALLLDYHRSTGRALGLSGAELEAHAHTEAERDTEQVAQPTRMATRSLAEITSTNPLAKVSWAYASEARQKIALAAWAATKATSEPAQFAKTMFLVFGVGGLMTQVLKNLWKEAKGDDDEKKWSPERLVLDALSSPLHGIPFVGALMNDGNMLSGASHLKSVDFKGDTVDVMRDVDTVLSVLGMFNDTAAGVSALSHAGLDAAKVLENLTDGK